MTSGGEAMCLKKDHNKKWYVAQIRQTAEKRAAKSLDKQGIEVFLPTRSTTVIWSDRRKKVLKPLFPGYLFVHLTVSEFAAVYKSPGFLNFVTFDGKKAILSQTEMDQIKWILQQDFRFIPSNFKIGQNIIIQKGPLKGMSGQLLELRGRCRIALLVKGVGKGVIIETSSEYVVDNGKMNSRARITDTE